MFKEENNKLGTIFSIGFIIVVFYFLIKDIHNIQSIILRSGVWAPIVAIFLYAVLSPTPISTDPITIIVGTIYGPLIGAVIAWIGNMLASFIEYYLGTRIHKVTNFDKTKKHLPFGLSKLPVNSPSFLILGRLIPFYGGKIISILAGIYKVPIMIYLWTTMVTNLLGSVILAFGGFHLINLLIK